MFDMTNIFKCSEKIFAKKDKVSRLEKFFLLPFQFVKFPQSAVLLARQLFVKFTLSCKSRLSPTSAFEKEAEASCTDSRCSWPPGKSDRRRA
jgi:hypothetical protein